MASVKVRLRDGRIVQIRRLRLEDKEKLVEMYAIPSEEAVQWGCRLTQESLGNMT